MTRKKTLINSPRVQINYKLELNGATETRELPCVIGLIANLTVDTPETADENNKIKTYRERKFIELNQENVNEVFLNSFPCATAKIGLDPAKLTEVSVLFKSLQDLNPEYILENVPLMNTLYQNRIKLSDLLTRVLNNEILYTAAEKLRSDSKAKIPELLKEFKFISEEQEKYIISLFEILKQIKTDEKNLIVILQKEINNTDDKIKILLDQFLHSKSYQKLESTWLGIKHLLESVNLGKDVRLKVLNASEEEIKKDILNSMAVDQSFLFKRLYEDGYGTYGGEAFTYLLLDQYIKKTNEDFEFCKKLSDLVALAHIPSVLSTHSSLFDLSNYTQLNKPRILSKIFESPEAFGWKAFREHANSRFVSCVLPSYLSRIPYGKYNKLKSINYEEDISKHENYLWTNSVYVYGAQIAISFEKTHWFASIVGPENGGRVTNLPVFSFKTPDGDSVIKCPTEVLIPDRRELELSELGFISLCYCKNTNYGSFFSGQSIKQPAKYNKPEANANAKLSSRFHYILNCSRFAHYIKCMMRDKVGSFSGTDDLSTFLNNWIKQYVLDMDEAPQNLKAKYPLRSAKVNVSDIEESPGEYKCHIFLVPHFQMEKIEIDLSLVAKIPGGDK